MSGYRVLISDCIIRNEGDININPKEFVLYCLLKMRYDRVKKCRLVVNHQELMCQLRVKTNSTFKNMLVKLYNCNLIKNNITELPKHKPLHIEMNEEYLQKSPFTMLHVNLIRLVPVIGYEGIRLMYYYESRINRKSDIQYCFAGVRLIAKETKINKNKFKDINNLLTKEKLLKMEQHELKEHEGLYGDNFKHSEDYLVTKFNNHYTPLLKNLEKYDMSKTYQA